MPDNAPENYNPYNGVIFALYTAEDVKAADGSVVIPAGSLMEFITLDAAGKADVKTDLPFGKYFVQEFQATAGYVRDDTKYDFAFDYAADNGAKVTIDINDGKPVENKLQRGSLQIIKTFEGTTVPIPGVPFTIVGTTTVGMQVTINAVTDEKGQINLDNLLVGNYKIQELDSPLTVGYVLSPEENAVVAAGQIAKLTINNKLQRGSLQVIKTFEGRTVPIANVPFHITGKTTVGGEFDQTYYTNEDGVINIEGLLVGDYTIAELASPLTESYILSAEQSFKVAPDEITKLTIDNRLIRGNVTLTKTDADYPDHKLSGAIFDIYADTNGDKKLDGGDVLIGPMTEKDGGVYEMLALQYGGYFVLEKQAPEGFIRDEKPYYFSIKTDGETVTIENEAGKGFINVCQTGSLRIIKTSSDGKKEGFTFKVDGDGYSETFVTDKNGEIFIGNLKIGKYVVSEMQTDANKGYKLPDSVTVEIIADQTLEVNVFNDKVTTNTTPENPGSPKTGDNSNMALWLTLIGVSGSGLLITLFAPKLKRKQRKATTK